MKQVIKYQAEDGKLFDSSEECQAYENKSIDQRPNAVFDIAVELYEEIEREKPNTEGFKSILNNLVVNLLKTKL